jgi:hypothetical protein
MAIIDDVGVLAGGGGAPPPQGAFAAETAGPSVCRNVM